MTDETRKDLVFYYRYNKDLQISAELTGLSVRAARQELERLGEIAGKPNTAVKPQTATDKRAEKRRYKRVWKKTECSFTHFILSSLRDPRPQEMEDLYALCGRIMVTRKAKGVSQTAVADALGISLNTYNKIETGKRHITPQALAMIMTGIDKASAGKEKK